ncbi:MAG: hypothetical protein WC269_05350 [Candidatus Gracilibacteria bacterium]|jgi:hypothetical protein
MPRRKKIEMDIVWGKIQKVQEGEFMQNRFLPFSQPYWKTILNRYSEGKKIGLQVMEDELSFSDAQRRYHFVLLRFIAKETGNSIDDEHEDAMRSVFGTKTYTNYKGEIHESRYSLSNNSDLTLPDVQKLIDHDLGVCDFLNIVVPSKESLGYVNDRLLPYTK